MNDNEVNRIIAEFMGKKHGQASDLKNCHTCPSCGFEPYLLYTESLDALVPVWEKLGVEPWFSGDKEFRWFCKIHPHFNGDITDYWTAKGSVIQQAAAHATAKCILELEGEK